MDGAALIVVTAGGILTIFTFLAATWKLFRFIFKVDRALPTLLNIAHQFENNSGSTLKDKIDDIVAQTEYLSNENRVAVRIAEDSRLIAETNAVIVNELTTTQSSDIQEMKEYLYEKFQAISETLTVASLHAELAEKRSARIETRLDKLFPLVVRNRKSDEEKEA